MAPSTPLLPGFAPGSGGTDGRRDDDASRPRENRDALQSHHSGTSPAPIPGAARAASGEPDAAGDDERQRDRPESRPLRLDGGAPAGEPGARPEPDFQRSPGDGDPGPAGQPGRFALRVGAERHRNGDAFPGRGDGVYPPTHAARVTASRAASGQSLLPFALPAWQRQPSALAEPAEKRDTPAASPGDLLPPPPPPVALDDGTVISPPLRSSGNRGPRPIARLTGPLAGSLRPGADSLACRQAPVAGPETQGDGEHAMEGITTTTSPTPGIPLRPGYGGQVPQRPGYGGQAATGEKAKARDIIAAIKTLQRIEREQRPATPDERQALARFGGFGAVALGIFPDPVRGAYKDATWQALGEELTSLLSPEEYDSAKRTTFNAFYTSPTVITTIHEAIARLGVPSRATILEPGCGTGNFMSHGKKGTHFIGVEMDSISGRIAKALHPEADIRIENFRDSRLPPIDAVIGNVPFADVKLDYHGQKLSLHDFFIAKSVDALKPGGVLAVVTSHYTLDKQNAAIREHLASQADFLGAIRLPSDAFKREGTAVVTDILFLRKRAPGQEPSHTDADWLETVSIPLAGAEIPINRYFDRHPEMVLGDFSRKDTLYGGEGFSIIGNGELAEQIREAVGRLPKGQAVQSEAERPNPPPAFTPAFAPPPLERHVTEGSFFIGEDKVIRQVEDGQGLPVTYCGVLLRADGTPNARKIAALIGLRDLARRVLQSQNEGWPEANRDAARRDLNRAYDLFVSQYGPINKTTFTETKDGGVIRRMPNTVKFREDPDAMLVMALEDYDEVTGKAAKAAIMQRDVVGPAPSVTSVASAEEGLLVSLDRKGLVDLPFIATLYGQPEQRIIEELGNLIYRDPETHSWQTADAYLSGNVRDKLAIAGKAGPAYARNAEALRAVQPEDVLPGDIDCNLGAPWVPVSDISDFAAGLFGVPPSSIQVGHLKKDAIWTLDAGTQAEQSVAATSEYGTPRINGATLLEQALNLKTPVIYDTVMNGDREERVVNQEATLAAREKQALIRQRFKAWAFADPDRTERLVRLYNDTYNNLRPRLFDGSHLDFPGMSKAIELRPHQKDAIWRCMSSGNTLLAHAVGAGKTWTVAAATMKKKQAGLARKPVIAVPNHMLEQFGREFMQLYPNAKLLVAAKEDFTKERRKFLTARIASGEWDGIIVTHSSFERIGMSRDYQEKFLLEQIKEYNELLLDGATRNTTRDH